MTRIGPFILHEEIGQGAMSRVWRATHHAQRSEVAVKIITISLADNPTYLDTFRAEVQATAKLEHPNIVAVFDEGRLPAGVSIPDVDSRAPYLAMEYVSGGTLQDAPPPTTWAQTQQILDGILSSLAHAHACGITHRDLKPANVLIDRSSDTPQIKLADFGIAQAVSTDGVVSIEAKGGAAVGTPRYMAPEQIRGLWREQGPWTDLYALGCIAFWLVCGRTPYHSTSTYTLLRQHAHAPIPALDPRFPIPAELQEWVHGLLAKTPRDRFERAADALFMLRQMAQVDDALFAQLEAIPTRDEGDPTQLIEVSPDLDAAAPARATAPRIIPPFPESWRPFMRERSQRHMLGAGLGLFALRPVPLVGREQELDLMWKMLRNVSASRRPGALVFEGPSGLGKSKIADTFSRLADELGLATIIRAHHNESYGPYGGISGAIARDFRVLGLPYEEVLEKIRDGLSTRRGYADDVIVYDAVCLSQYAVTAKDTTTSSTIMALANAEERFAVLARWLEDITRRRPVIFWIDDAQWDPDGLRVVRYVLEHMRIPVFFVITVRDDALARRFEQVDQLDALDRFDRVTRRAIAPLNTKQHRKLISGLLGLDDALVDAIAARTHGNPLFAVQLVDTLVERGELHVGERGFVHAGPLPTLPSDLHEVWASRTNHVLDRLPGHRDANAIALELAACLGQEFSLTEWAEALDSLGLPRPRALVNAMSASRLFILDERRDLLAFVHGMLRESIEQLSRDAGRWARLNMACAKLVEVYAPYDPRGRGRHGYHLLEAGEPASALLPLYQSAWWYVERDDFIQAAYTLELRKRALNMLELDQTSAPQLESRLVEGWLEARRMENKTAMQLARFVEDHARDQDLGPLLGRALRLVSKLDREANPERSLAKLEEAIVLLARAQDWSELGKAKLALAWSYGRRGSVDDALALIDEACQHFDQNQDELWIAIAMRAKGFFLGQTGRFAEARECIEFAMREAQRVGSSSEAIGCQNMLGEFARSRHDWREALYHYQQCELLDRSMGGANTTIFAFNGALAALGSGAIDDAKARIEALVRRWPDVQKLHIEPFIHAALLAIAASYANWSDYQRALSLLEREIERKPVIDRDIIWCIDHAVALARQHGQDKLAERTLADTASIRTL